MRNDPERSSPLPGAAAALSLPPAAVSPSMDSFSRSFLGEASHLLAMLDFRVILEARNPAGRSRSYVVRDEEAARHTARSILKRRATAPIVVRFPNW